MKNINDFFLLVTGFCPDVKLLTNQELLYNVLKELPGIIDMRGIREPIISEASDSGGLEGYVPIDTSNITISTYTKDNPRIVAEVHSCKDFDYEKVLDFFKKNYDCSMKYEYLHESDFRGSK